MRLFATILILSLPLLNSRAAVDIAGVGDSIMEGYPVNVTDIAGTPNNQTAMDIIYQVATLGGFTGTNCGYPAHTWAQVNTSDIAWATNAWQTIVYIGTTSSNYTSQVTVQWPATQCTVTNLQAGKRYYFTVAHTDLEDVSDKSNEVSAKTKMNPPKTLIVIP